MNLEEEHRACVAELAETQAQLSALPKIDSPERESLKARIADLLARMADLKSAIKQENTQRNFAGLTSPLAEAMRARLDPSIVAELESDAIARQRERERIGSERRAAKAAQKSAAKPAEMAPAPPSRAMTRRDMGAVEVVHRRVGGVRP